ncbi:NADP-dependent malic enzyme [Frankliniella fusca]|uniref:NADP-dependent malic enzyme n=1 Tax=Frankliniella fusca TaxID=407009 RepID=A0AAE1HAE4_9NEOP|nr:NADP-dependent malic enzyme [Frankliniella fusca]
MTTLETSCSDVRNLKSYFRLHFTCDTSAHFWLHYAVLLLETYATSCCLNALYAMLPTVLTACAACSDLHADLGRQLEAGPATPVCATIQSTLLHACLVMDKAVRDLLPHILIGVAAVALVSTVEMVSSGSLQDIYSLNTAPLILTIFIPICLAGERLGEARREVAVRAARGPWLEEDSDGRKLRLGVLVAAGGSGAQLRGDGLGTLDKPACLAALKSWFSFVQMIVNLHDRA